MPLMDSKDYRVKSDGIKFCLHCLNEDESLKTFEEVVQGTAGYLESSQGLSKSAAYDTAKSMITKMPAWKDKKHVN
jgi:hypothetical protein